MTDMPLAYWCVLIAALLPLPLVAYAKSASRDNHNPRDSAGNLQGANRRAYAAHQNTYENFPFFAAAVIVAITQGATISTVNTLAAIYIALRIAYAACYITDAASLRSVAYLLALVTNIAIFVLPLFK
jgi:uncharacterized MAPEG superfamily protein